MTASEQRVAKWYNHAGGVIEAPWVDGRQTAYRWDDGRTHAVFGSQSPVPLRQALTVCGRRALEIPGGGQVDCPQCIESLRSSGERDQRDEP